jgi:hypothetical protein
VANGAPQWMGFLIAAARSASSPGLRAGRKAHRDQPGRLPDGRNVSGPGVRDRDPPTHDFSQKAEKFVRKNRVPCGRGYELYTQFGGVHQIEGVRVKRAIT